MDRASVYDAVFGKDAMAKVRAAKVLVVGAGGIGCELLKNLALAGFSSLEVVDLDTIDVSNLNRQFLFRPQHVGQSKSAVAAEAASAFNPAVGAITSYHGNVIKGRQFTADFFRDFDLVINALDNQAARSHVNRMCLATGRPLIEGGSTGFAGQAHTIAGGTTMCYDCQPKPVQKTYPVCTIRSTPDKPIHCIVWAKELHKLLIGNAEESVLYEPEDDESGTAGGAGASSSGSGVSSSESVYMRAVRHPSETTATSPDALAAWARGAFDAVFRLEIEKKLAMGDTYKTAKHSPTPLVLSECVAAAGGDSNGDRTVAASTSTLPSQRAPTVAEACAAFLGACTDAFSDAGRRQRAGTVEFDKDDTISMRLVASAANLRAHTFGIPMLSEFEIKSIAGNIVPAIATTNAVVAGLETLEAIKVLSGRDLATEASYTAVLTTGSSNGRTVSGDRPQPPSRACKECGRARVMLRLDTAAVTLGDLLRGPIKGAMRFREPNVLFTAAEGEAEGSHFSFLEDEDDPAMLGRPLDRLPAGGLGTGAIFAVDDFALDGARVEVVLAHVPAPDGTPAADAIELVGAFDAPAAAAAAAKTKADAAAALAAAASAPAAAEDDSDDDFEMEGDDGDEGAPDEDSEDDFQLVEEDDEAAAAGDSSSSGSRKRPREEDEDGAKRTKLTGSGPAGAPGP